jgi:hypothetical protein
LGLGLLCLGRWGVAILDPHPPRTTSEREPESTPPLFNCPNHVLSNVLVVICESL